jgi:predicted enzyme related to lactoylglutathione lyase
MEITDANITVMVTDMEVSVNFYQMLGLTLKQRWENHYAMLTAPGVVIGLHPSEAIPSSKQVSIGLMVADINEAKKLLDEQEVNYVFDDGKSGAYLHFTDPDGTVLYYTQPKWNYD